MRPRALLLIAFGAAILAGGALVAYWLWSADRLADWIAAWTSEQRARGYEITYRGPEIDGFPFRLRARFTEPRVISPRGWRWTGPSITGQASLWDPFTIEIDFAGQHRVSPTHRRSAAGTEAEAEWARAVIRLEKTGRIERGTAETSGVTIRRSDRSLRAARITARLGPLKPASANGAQELRFSGEASDVTLPDGGGGPLGRKLQQLAFEATLVGEIPSGDERQVLEQWRDAGGILKVRRLKLAWGNLTLDGDGTLGLDRQLRPLGAFTTRMRGLSRTMDRLVAAGLIKPNQALAAKIGLSALAGGTDAEGNSVVVLPITLQDGLLYLGPAPLLPIFPVL